MRVDPKVAQATPPQPPAPKPPPTEEEKKKAARKANWISAGIFFAATGAGAGVSYVLNSFAPKAVGKATEPVLNTTVGVGQSAGGRFQEQYLTPIRSWVFRTSTGPGSDAAMNNGGTQQSKVIYPAILASMIEVSNQRNKLNGRVSGQSDGFAFYRALLQVSCEAASARIAEGDLRGGARHLAGALYHDHRIWMEMSPKSQHTFDRMYMQMYPYFHQLPKEKLEELRKAVRDEAERLSSGKREGLGEYVDAIVKGITSGEPEKRFAHPLVLQAPGEKATVSLEAVRQLAPAANDENPDSEIRAAIEAHFKQLLDGKNWFQRFQLRRTQRRVTKNVLKICDAKMKELGRTLSMEELWTVVQGSLNADASKRIENKITAISFGAFAGVGAASGVGKFYLEKAVSPQIMIGLEAVVFTLVGIAMGTAGSFFQDRFNNIARAFGYGGMEKLTLGGHVERELLDNLLRTWTVDGRVFGGRNAYQWYSRYLHGVVTDAQSAIKAGELDVAATYLANASEYGRTMFFSFSPLMEVFELFFDKVGPHFDCLTEAQRDELLRMVEEQLQQRGATPKEMTIYHKPFIQGLLLTNVEPRKP